MNNNTAIPGIKLTEKEECLKKLKTRYKTRNKRKNVCMSRIFDCMGPCNNTIEDTNNNLCKKHSKTFKNGSNWLGYINQKPIKDSVLPFREIENMDGKKIPISETDGSNLLEK